MKIEVKDPELNKLQQVSRMWDCVVICPECENESDITVSHHCPKCYTKMTENPFIEEIKKLRPVVEVLLTKYPELRDNDNRLMLNVWSHQNKRMKEEDFSFRDFAVSFIEGKYANPESIRRTRQKLQEENHDLRGNNYEKRQKQAEETRKAIK